MDALKAQLTKEEVVDLTKGALNGTCYYQSLNSMKPVPLGDEKGSEHACWMINESLVLRARYLAPSEGNGPKLEDVITSLQMEAAMKDIIRTEALRESSDDYTYISECVPASIAYGIWRNGTSTADASREVVVYSIEERKYGFPLDIAPLVASSDHPSQGILSPTTVEGFCSLLSLLQRPGLIAQAQSIRVRMHEAIDLNEMTVQSQATLQKMIDEATQKGNSEINKYMSWQKKLSSENCLGLCKRVSASMEIPDFDLQAREREVDNLVLLHADLKGEHILVDGNGLVSGLLDWTDAALGPGYIDIAGLAISVGSPVAIEIALGAGYGLEPCRKGILFARSRSLLYLYNREGPPWLVERQAQRAFEDLEI